jgi:hypothetical protein
MSPSDLDRVRGCLLGGAVGDALGAPAEFMSTAQVERILVLERSVDVQQGALPSLNCRRSPTPSPRHICASYRAGKIRRSPGNNAEMTLHEHSRSGTF